MNAFTGEQKKKFKTLGRPFDDKVKPSVYKRTDTVFQCSMSWKMANIIRC